MTNVSINQLPVASTIDPANDYLPIYTASQAATQGITRNTLLGITSSPVGINDTQTLTNKTLTNPTVNGATLSGTLSGTYTLGGTPTFPATVVTTTGTQTLTNKTIASPTISSPTITNATLSADSITGYSNATNGSIFGLSVTSSKISGTSITNQTIGPNQLATGGQSNFTINTGGTATTTSTSYTTTLTGGTSPTVTVTVGVNGLVLLAFSCGIINSGANGSVMSFQASGANTITAADNNGTINNTGTNTEEFGYTRLLTGLTAGSTTFTGVFKVTAGTGTFFRTSITAIPL